MGHGEKSVSILQDFIKLTDVEKLAIRWHGLWSDALAKMHRAGKEFEQM